MRSVKARGRQSNTRIVFQEIYPWEDGAAALGAAVRKCVGGVSGMTVFAGRAESPHQEPLPPVVVLCLGSRQVPGDSLGPLVGSRLQLKLPQVPVYGTLRQPLDSRNLEEELSRIDQEHPRALQIAVDAAIGPWTRVGQVSVRRGPLIPGIGLGHILPLVGEVSITAVVRPRSAYFFQCFWKNCRIPPERWAEILAPVISQALEEALGPI